MKKAKEAATKYSWKNACLGDDMSYNRKLWIDPLMKEAAYPSV